MKKFFRTLIVLPIFLIAQEETTSNSRWLFGGNFGLAFGTQSFFQIAPSVGYQVSRYLIIGGGAGYINNRAPNFRSNLYSVGGFIQPRFDNFFIRADYGYYTGDVRFDLNNQKQTVNEHVLVLGLGYMDFIGGNSFYNVGIGYNVLYNENKSVFSTGFMPYAGVMFGF